MGGTRRQLDPHRSHLLQRGDLIAIGGVSGGAVAYLAIAGGFDLTPFLGSVSTYARAAIGPLGGKALATGGTIPLRCEAAPEASDLLLTTLMDYGEGPIRVVPGPQADRFTPEAMGVFLSSVYAISNESDRMGLRLSGPKLDHRDGADIASDALISGCIQVPGTGQPIILLADHQTTGGYAKIATVISADLPRLGRAAPGTALRFAAVTVAEAEEARKGLEARYRQSLDSIVRPGSVGRIDLDKLYTVNLLSGFVVALAAGEEG
jgi:biotin-dependent carboxylase-like uncharacterized protein